MRILYVTHWAARPGGAEHSLRDIITESVTRAQTDLVTTEPGWLCDRAAAAGATCHILPCDPALVKVTRWGIVTGIFRHAGAFLSFLRYCLKLRALVRRLNPAVLHANVPKSHLALFLLRLSGIRTPMIVHCREIMTGHTAARFLYLLLCPRRNLTVFAISRAVRESLPPPLIRLSVIVYNGVVLPTSVPSRSPGPVFLLVLGRVVPWKGIHRIVAAFAVVSRELDLRLTVVGDTSYWDPLYREDIEMQIEQSGIAGCCRLEPGTDDPDRYYRTHHLFCSASDREPFGRTVAEAQAWGLPVIGYDSGGIGEIVLHNKTGILVPYGDDRQYREAIRLLVRDRTLREEMGNRGRDRAAKLFNREIRVPGIVTRVIKAGEEP